MKGRMEQQISIEEKIENTLKDKSIILKDYILTFNDKTFNTEYNYINSVLRFEKYLLKEYSLDFSTVKNIKQINFIHIQKYLNNLSRKSKDERYSVSNVNSSLYAIKDFFKYLVKCGYIDSNPCDKVEASKEKKENKVVYLNENEIKLIEYNIRNGVGNHRSVSYMKKWVSRDLCIFFIGITTGLRVSAIRNINIEDIDIEESTITTVEKGNVERKIYISNKVMDIIKEYLEDRKDLVKGNYDALFISSQGSRLSTETIRRLIHKYSYNIDKKITPHKMRSTAASNLYQKTGDIYLVADILGHSNIQNTRRYASVSIDNKKNAANILGDLI